MIYLLQVPGCGTVTQTIPRAPAVPQLPNYLPSLQLKNPLPDSKGLGSERMRNLVQYFKHGVTFGEHVPLMSMADNKSFS